jgi:penicillin-binding protein 2
LTNWDKELNYRRVLIIFGIFFLIFGGLLVRLTIIQVFGYMKYSRLAATQRQSPLLTNILRGGFYDRNGKMLRGTVRSWYLLIEKASAARSEQITDGMKLFMAGNFAAEYLKNKERAFWIFPKPLSNYQIDKIIALDYPECKIVANVLRQDHYQGIAWHLLGVADQERGSSGLEYLYQPILRSEATSGAIFTLNDGKQRFFPGLGVRTQSKPNPVGVVLTIDRRIQQIAEQVMDHHAISGAVVVLDAGNGEILAMASRPRLDSFDEEIFSRDHPFVNRAVSAYHPGSIFKLVILSAGLDGDQLKPDEYFEDRGFYQIGDKKWLCTTSRNGHGVISLKDALAYSCNPIFIEITMRLKPQIILEYADKFGLGQPCNIGLRTESWGELPTGIGLSEGEIANLALGQQDIYATPLQIASLVQTIANNGIRCIPQLVVGIMRQSGAAIAPLAKAPSVRVLKAETANIVKDMMAAVVSYGTGAGVRLGSDVAGKTGTAQVNDEQGAPSHAWFAGFYPLTQPKYVTVVFCEQGLSGAETAAPVFKELMEKVTRIED